MHPLLATPGRIVLYLLAWIPVAGLLTVLLALNGGLGWGEAAALAVPLAFVDALVCLAPWYPCRMLPLGLSRFPTLLANHVGGALFASGLWILAAKWLAQGLTRFFPGIYQRFVPQLPLLFGLGILGYGLA